MYSTASDFLQKTPTVNRIYIDPPSSTLPKPQATPIRRRRDHPAEAVKVAKEEVSLFREATPPVSQRNSSLVLNGLLLLFFDWCD